MLEDNYKTVYLQMIDTENLVHMGMDYMDSYKLQDLVEVLI